MVMKPKPVAVCTRCGMLQYDATAINQRCSRRAGTNRCDGVYGSRLSNGDWIECPACNATGRSLAGLCAKCAGVGWFAHRTF